MSDAKGFMVNGIPLPCKDEEAREDIAEINNSLTQLDGASQFWFGVYPTGKVSSGDSYITIQLPNKINASPTITIGSVYVYDSNGYNADITNSCSIHEKNNFGFTIKFTYNNTHAGKLCRINYTVAYS